MNDMDTTTNATNNHVVVSSTNGATTNPTNNNDQLIESKTNKTDETSSLSSVNNKDSNVYDVIIVGTGLIESILCCSLTMQHLNVLHIDENNYYGQNDTSLTLSDIIKWSKKTYENQQEEHASLFPSNVRIHSYSNNSNTTRYFVGQYVLMNPYGYGIVIEYNNNSSSTTTNMTDSINSRLGRLVVELVSPKQSLSLSASSLSSSSTPPSDHKTTISFQWMTNDNDTVSIYKQVIPITQIYLNQILDNIRYDRMFAFDLNGVKGSLILSNDIAVTGMLKSKVSDYLEFKSIDKLQIMFCSSDNNNTVMLTSVPCHKSDVFNSKLLQPLEKRKLMKLLQLVLEYDEYISLNEQQQEEEGREDNTSDKEEEEGREDNTSDREEEEGKESNEASNHNNNDEKTEGATTVKATTTTTTTIDNYNERNLQYRGKSLKRPQNKKAATTSLQRLMDQYITTEFEKSFEEYLRIEHKMSNHLITIIIYALCLSIDKKQLSVSNGFHLLSTHINSLGKFGSTAFITPLYGCGELSQSFCRKSAVLGTTYMLRQKLLNIKYNNNNDISSNICGVTLTEVNDDEPSSSNKIYEETATTTTTTTTANDEGSKTTEIKCSRVVLSSGAAAAASTMLPKEVKEESTASTSKVAETHQVINRISLLYISDETLGLGTIGEVAVATHAIQTLLAQSLIVVVPFEEEICNNEKTTTTTTTTNNSAVYVTFKNHLVNVCCPPSNYIVVHMSTERKRTIPPASKSMNHNDTHNYDEDIETYMKHTLQNILRGAIIAAATTTTGGGGGTTATPLSKDTTSLFNKNLIENVELFHVCYSTETTTATARTKEADNVKTSNTTNGIYVVKQPTLSNHIISIDTSFHQAKVLFDDIMNDISANKEMKNNKESGNSTVEEKKEIPKFLEISKSLQNELEEAQKGHGGGGGGEIGEDENDEDDEAL